MRRVGKTWDARHYVVCGAMESSPGRFVPAFTVYDGVPTAGLVVYRHEDYMGCSHVNAIDAISAAEALSFKWISINLP